MHKLIIVFKWSNLRNDGRIKSASEKGLIAREREFREKEETRNEFPFALTAVTAANSSNSECRIIYERV